MRYLIFLLLFLLAQLGWKPPHHPRPTPTAVPTGTPTPALPRYTTNVRVTYISNAQYRGYLCMYPGDPGWYRCQQVITVLPGGGRIIHGYTLKPGS